MSLATVSGSDQIAKIAPTISRHLWQLHLSSSALNVSPRCFMSAFVVMTGSFPFFLSGASIAESAGKVIYLRSAKHLTLPADAAHTMG